MDILLNAKHEKFAQYLAQGETLERAYVSAGYRSKQAATCACRLSKKAHIQARVAQLKAQIAQVAVTSTGIDKAWVMKQLRKNYERAMLEEPVRDREGNPTGEYLYNGSVANRSLELIGKELGMFVDRKDITLRKPIAEMSEEELLQLYTEANEQLAGAPDDSGRGARQTH